MPKKRQKTIEQMVEQAKREILEDLENETFSKEEITSFSDLHDHVDANWYGGLFEQPLNLHIMNKVQDSLDNWIKSPEFN